MPSKPRSFCGRCCDSQFQKPLAKGVSAPFPKRNFVLFSKRKDEFSTISCCRKNKVPVAQRNDFPNLENFPLFTPEQGLFHPPGSKKESLAVHPYTARTLLCVHAIQLFRRKTDAVPFHNKFLLGDGCGQKVIYWIFQRGNPYRVPPLKGSYLCILRL